MIFLRGDFRVGEEGEEKEILSLYMVKKRWRSGATFCSLSPKHATDWCCVLGTNTEDLENPFALPSSGTDRKQVLTVRKHQKFVFPLSVSRNKNLCIF